MLCRRKNSYLGLLRSISPITGSVVHRHFHLCWPSAMEDFHVMHEVLIARLDGGAELQNMMPANSVI